MFKQVHSGLSGLAWLRNRHLPEMLRMNDLLRSSTWPQVSSNYKSTRQGNSMDSRSQEQSRPQKKGRNPGTDALKWVIAHPVAAFIVVTLGSLVLAAVLYQASLFWPLAGKTSTALGIYSNASALVQAIVGTALVGASAFVAILIATSAAKTAESALSESRLNNKLNDPDYLSAKQALRGYQRYAFQIGSLLAAWRLHRQQSQLQAYVTGEDTGLRAPLWENTLEQLQELLSDASFVSAIYEAASLLDSESRNHAGGETHVQALRKSVAGLGCIIESILRHKDTAGSSDIMMNLMARSALLVHQLELGREVMERYAPGQETEPGDDPRLQAYPLLRWLVAWTGQIPIFETDRNFRDFLRIPFGEVFVFGGTDMETALPDAVGDVLAAQMPDEPGARRYGIHRGMLVITSVGDQSTILSLERLAAETARKQGFEPHLVHVSDPNSVPKFGQDAESARFQIFSCTRKTLPFLFRDGVLGPATRGCVIIDGVRGDGLCEIEEQLEKLAGIRKSVPKVVDLVQSLALHAGSSGKLQRSQFSALSPGDEKPEAGSGPRMLWIGVDYRELGVEPGSRLGDWSCELWSILQRDGSAIGVDAAQMLKLG